MAFLAKYWPAGLSALLLLLAFPPFNLGLLAFIALAPWLLFIKNASARDSVKSGLVFGFIFMGAQMYWLQPLVARWTESFWLGLIPALLAPLIGMWYFALGGWLIHVCWRRNWPWMIPVVWAGIEVLRSYCPGLAFPWGLVATPLWPYSPLIQLAWFGGIYLVSSWVAIANVLAAKLLAGEGFVAVRNYLIVFLALGIGSGMRVLSPPEGTKTPIMAGQLGIDLAFGDKFTIQNSIGPVVESLRGSAITSGSKLLVLPEGLVRGGDGLPPPIPFGLQGNIPLLFGGQRGKGPTYQSAYAYDGEWKVIDKTRLVVFGEYVPFRAYLPFLETFRLPTGDLTPGEKVSTVEVGGFQVGPLLCFEGLFPDVASAQARNGAQLLAVMALDDWYFGTPAPEQLMTASVFRAVETGTPVVRVGSLGYTVAVDARGNILAMAPLKQKFGLRAELVLPQKPDHFAGVDVYRYAAPLLSAALAAFALRDRRRGEKDSKAA